MLKVEKVRARGVPKKLDFLAVNEEVRSGAQLGAAPGSSADALCRGTPSAAHTGGAFTCRVSEVGCLGAPGDAIPHLQKVDEVKLLHPQP